MGARVGEGVRVFPVSVWLWASVPVIFWGNSFVVTKALYAEWPPLTVAAVRWLLASAVFAAYLPVRGQTDAVRRILRREWRAALVFGFVGVALLFALQNLALVYTTAANASVLGNLVPLFVVLLSVVFLDERLTRRLALATLVGTLGAILFSLQGGAFAVAPNHLLGDGLTLLAALAGAIYVVLGKRFVDRYPAPVVAAVAAGVGALFLLPTALLVEGLPAWPSPAALGGILFLGVGAGMAGHLAWWKVAEALPANRAVLFILLIPAVGALAGALFLGDPLTPPAIVGGILILSALYLAEAR